MACLSLLVNSVEQIIRWKCAQYNIKGKRLFSIEEQQDNKGLVTIAIVAAAFGICHLFCCCGDNECLSCKFILSSQTSWWCFILWPLNNLFNSVTRLMPLASTHHSLALSLLLLSYHWSAEGAWTDRTVG